MKKNYTKKDAEKAIKNEHARRETEHREKMRKQYSELQIAFWGIKRRIGQHEDALEKIKHRLGDINTKRKKHTNRFVEFLVSDNAVWAEETINLAQLDAEEKALPICLAKIKTSLDTLRSELIAVDAQMKRLKFPSEL